MKIEQTKWYSLSYQARAMIEGRGFNIIKLSEDEEKEIRAILQAHIDYLNKCLRV